MSRRVRGEDHYTDRLGRVLQRCPNPDALNNFVFVTVESPFLAGVDLENVSISDILLESRRTLYPMMDQVLRGQPFYNDRLLHIVGIYQGGRELRHSHIHFLLNLSLNRVYTNISVFDAFARRFRDPVLKSCWSVQGLNAYLLKAGSIVVFNFGDENNFPLNERENEEVDGGKKGFSLRRYVKIH